MVVHFQVRRGHTHLHHFRTLPIQLRRRRLLRLARRPFGHAADNPGGVQLGVAAQTFNHVLHPLQRMLGQQLEHADVLPHPRPGAVTSLQTLPELGKHPGKLPAAVDVRMVQRRRTTAQRRQIVPRIEHLVARRVAPPVAGNHTIAMHDVHPIDVRFHGHRLERVRPGHAVLHVLETHQLILVDLPGPHHARVERVPGQRQRRRPGLAPTVHRSCRRCHDASAGVPHGNMPASTRSTRRGLSLSAPASTSGVGAS